MTTRTSFMLLVALTGVAVEDPPSLPGRSSPSVRFGQSIAAIEEALECYADLSGRIILRSESLPGLPAFTKAGLPADTNAAVARIREELAGVRILVVPDGEKFARTFTVEWTNSAAGRYLSRLKPTASGKSSDPDGGAVNVSFRGVTLDQVLDTYQQLSGRNILRPAMLPDRSFSLLTRSPLSKQEFAYAAKVVMGLNGLAAMDDGDHFVQVVPIEAESRVKLASPKRKPGASLFDPRKVPSFALEAAQGTRPVMDRLTALWVQFLGNAPPWARSPRPVDTLVEFYAGLRGWNAVRSDRFGQSALAFDLSTPLTEEEVLYAIETTLRLNNLTIVNVGERTVSAGHITEERAAERGP